MAIQQEQQKPPKSVIFIPIVVFLVSLLWVLAGIAAFITSIVCFGKSGTTSQHAIGLILAFLFGPFYWIYYFAAKNSYCR